MARRRDAVPDEWLVEHYGRGTIDDTRDAIEREFGWRPTRQTVYVRANRLGLRKDRECTERRGDRVERVARWSRMPEESAWMAAHDKGQRTDLLADEFEARFGWRLTRNQVNQWRARTGTQPKGRKVGGGGRPRVPVGTERVSKDGYVVVKVAEEATVAMSKDNWRLKHVHVWEQANGPLPEGMVVYFADGDRRNFDVGNLVAVPRRLVGTINSMGVPWHDAEELRAVVAMAEVKYRMREAWFSAERTCEVCGARFVPDRRYWTGYMRPPKTCPDCLRAGHKASGRPRIDRALVRELVAGGMSPTQVAERLGICRDTVYRVVRGDA